METPRSIRRTPRGFAKVVWPYRGPVPTDLFPRHNVLAVRIPINQSYETEKEVERNHRCPNETTTLIHYHCTGMNPQFGVNNAAQVWCLSLQVSTARWTRRSAHPTRVSTEGRASSPRPTSTSACVRAALREPTARTCSPPPSAGAALWCSASRGTLPVPSRAPPHGGLGVRLRGRPGWRSASSFKRRSGTGSYCSRNRFETKCSQKGKAEVKSWGGT